MKSSFIPFGHVETDSKACASLCIPLVFHPRYAPQVLQIRSQYLKPGNYGAFSLIQSSTITLAHSYEQYMKNYGKFMETSIPRART